MPSQHDKELRVPTNFRLPRLLIAAVRARAETNGETVTELVIRALRREVEQPCTPPAGTRTGPRLIS
jgi:hypothetical protein